MTQGWIFRAVLAAGLAAAGLVAALWMGASALAALVALVAGAAAFALLPRSRQEGLATVQAEATEEPDLPDAAEVLGAIDEPRLIVRNRRVLIANRAAKTLLGQHIEGVDVRLAIRHPAAAERLVDRSDDEVEPVARTELVGLGEPGRRWEMAVSRLADGSQLVRLTDRSQTHAAEQMRVDFVANASHELRTPLATLLGFLETLQDEDAGGDPKTRRRFLDVMQTEAERMRTLLEDLMSLSRIEADRYSVPRDPVRLLPLIDEVKTVLAPAIEESGSNVLVENEAGDAAVAGDRPQIAQLLNNLLTNALRYGRAGTPVRVRLEEAGPEMIRIGIIDQGEGIAPEHLPRLTERFYRVDAGRSRSVGGTGLGLAIVKHIVGRHRGRIDIQSALGEGTRVDVYLPRAQEEESKTLS